MPNLPSLKQIQNYICDSAKRYWHGYDGENAIIERFAAVDRATWPNTFLGSTLLAYDTKWILSHRQPYFTQQIPLTFSAFLGGLIASPGAALTTAYHIVRPGNEGFKRVIPRDIQNLKRAVKCMTFGLPLTAMRIVGTVIDPLLYLKNGLPALYANLHYRFVEKNTAAATCFKRYGIVALGNIDGQIGFTPTTADKLEGSGEFPVTNAQKALEHLAQLASCVRTSTTILFQTQDWHPEGHCSFSESYGEKNGLGSKTINGQKEQTTFPKHCIANTPGARFHPLVEGVFKRAITILKGYTLCDDSYGGFGGNTKTDTLTVKTKTDASLEYQESVNKTELAAQLEAHHVSTLVLGGLARDFCVHNTALQALQAGFNVIIATDATRGTFKEDGEEGNAKCEALKAELEKAAQVGSARFGREVFVEFKTNDELLKMKPYFHQTA